MALVPKKAATKEPEHLSSLAMAVAVLPVPPSEEIDVVPLDNPSYQEQLTQVAGPKYDP